MAERSGEMDSLFEGMEFVMGDASEFLVDADTNGVVETKAPNQNVSADIHIPMITSPVVAVALPARSSPSSLTSPPSLPRNASSSFLPTAPMSPSAPGVLHRDPSAPLDESLFSGLNVSIVDEDGSRQLPFENAGLKAVTDGKSGPDSVAEISVGSVQHARSTGFDEKSSGEGVVNGEKDLGGVESIMAGYNNVSPSQSSLKHSVVGNPAITTRIPGSSSTSSPSTKPSMRRKKRSMKIGYGRGDEEQEESSLRRGADKEKYVGAINAVSAPGPGSSMSSAKFAHSGASIQDRLDSEEFFESPSLAGENEASAGEISVIGTRDEEAICGGRSRENQATSLEEVSQVYPTELDERVYDDQERDVTKQTAHGTLKTGAHGNDSGIASRDGVKSPSILPTVVRVADVAEAPQTLHSESPSSESPTELRGDGMETNTSENETESTEVKNELEGLRAEAGEPATTEDWDIKMLLEQRGGTIEERVEYVKEVVARKMKSLQEKSSPVLALRKAAVQKRRRSAQEVSAASVFYKNLEAELDAACECEDFEKADGLSGSVAEAEEALKQAIEAVKVAEAECDATALKVQEILDLQVATEQEGVLLLESLRKEAEEFAERVRNEAQATVDQEMERLNAEEEAGEFRRRKLALQLRVIEEAKVELHKAIEEATKSETKDKLALSGKRAQLDRELQDLLGLVRAKEAQIAEIDLRIADVNEKVNTVVANFEKQRIRLEEELESLADISQELENEFSRITSAKQAADELLADSVKEGQKMQRVARLILDGVNCMQEDLGQKKAIATSTLFYREKTKELTKKEKLAEADARLLREKSVSARYSLQDLTAVKMRLSQDIAAAMQHILFVEKRGPELESEKKLAAGARNFKEAGRLAAEAKALVAERESATTDMARMTSELQMLEAQIENEVNALVDIDKVVGEKDKEVAMARCEKLRLIAAAAQIERDTAIDLEDFDEAESLDSEAEAANLEAEELQRQYELQGRQYENQCNSIVTGAAASDEAKPS